MRDIIFLKRVGLRVKQLRKSKGLSQEELAELTGMHPTYISEIERATVNASIKSLNKIVLALKIPMYEFFTFATKKSEGKDVLLKEIATLLEKQDMILLKHAKKTITDLVDLYKKSKKKTK